MKTIILAAGYATRLYPLTENKPKALLPIGPKPLLDHLMQKIEAIPQMDELVLVTNDRFYKQFNDWCRTASKKIRVQVLNDGTTSNDNRLGAIGDLRFAIRSAKINDDILVLASDNLFDGSLADFVAFARKSGGAAIGTYDLGDPQLGAKKYGIIETDAQKKITRIEEKPEKPKASLVSMGIYYFPKKSLPLIDAYLQSAEKQDAPGHYATWLLSRLDVFSYTFRGRWYDIGSFEQLEEANRKFRGES